jgi:hypothetical protein
MKRYQHKSVDRLNTWINEKLNKVHFPVIHNIHDYFSMTATIIANDPILWKQMYIDKVDTFAKAHAAVKANKQATTHSKMLTASGTNSSEMDFVSSYRQRRGLTPMHQAKLYPTALLHGREVIVRPQANQATRCSQICSKLKLPLLAPSTPVRIQNPITRK